MDLSRGVPFIRRGEIEYASLESERERERERWSAVERKVVRCLVWCGSRMVFPNLFSFNPASPDGSACLGAPSALGVG